MAALPDSQARPRLLTPKLGFQALHYQNFPFDRHAPVIAHDLGVYSSLTKAQIAAKDAFEYILLGYLSKGHFGRCSDDPIDLVYRGLITAYVDVRRGAFKIREEVWLSEFGIQIVEVSEPTWEANTISGGEEALFNMATEEGINASGRKPTPPPVVNLPVDSRTARPIRVLQRPKPKLPQIQTRYSQEQEPTWARSRTA